MNKVIIDGVDISGCNMKCDNGDCALYYAELNNDNNELIYGFNCSDNQDCYYKQLKRLQHYQAEFEHELMNDYTYDGYISPNGFTPIDVIKHIKSELKRLEQENERLKKQYNCYACDSCGGKEDYINMKRHTENAIKTVHKYSQALQEIKEIAGFHTSKDDSEDVQSDMQDIIDKINSVIGAEE